MVPIFQKAFWGQIGRWIFYSLTFPPLFFALLLNILWKKAIPTIDLKEIKQVLVIRLDQIGDVIMTIPFLRELKRNMPNAHISLIVRKETFNLVECCPYVDDIMIFDFNTRDYWGKFLNYFVHLYHALRLSSQHLRPRGFQLAIIPRSDADYYLGTFISYLSGSPRRVGFDENFYPWKRIYNPTFNSLLTHIIGNTLPQHEVQNSLGVIRFLKGDIQDENIEMWFNEKDFQFERQFVSEFQITSQDFLIALGTGANDGRRIWPMKNFIEIARVLLGQYKAKFLLIGGPSDQSLARDFIEQFPQVSVDLTGKTTLRQAIIAMKNCRLFLGNDSGPMHLASAAGIPVVEISCHPLNGKPWHPNSPKLYGPWRVPSRVVQHRSGLGNCLEGCREHHPHCITQIRVHDVLSAVNEILADSSND